MFEVWVPTCGPYLSVLLQCGSKYMERFVHGLYWVYLYQFHAPMWFVLGMTCSLPQGKSILPQDKAYIRGSGAGIPDYSEGPSSYIAHTSANQRFRTPVKSEASIPPLHRLWALEAQRTLHEASNGGRCLVWEWSHVLFGSRPHLCMVLFIAVFLPFRGAP